MCWIMAVVCGRHAMADSTDPGIALKDKFNCGGWSCKFDSYRSSQGPYNAATAGDEAVVTVNAVGNSVFSMYSSCDIMGDAYIGPGGNVGSGFNLSGGSVITGEKGVLGFPIDIPNHSAPTGSPFSGSHDGNVNLWGSNTMTVTGDRYFNKMTLSSNAKLIIDGDVTILLNNSLNISGSSEIKVLPGSRLILYVKGGCSIGNDINMHTDDPSACYIYMIGNNKTFSMYSGSKVCAVVSNPKGNISIWSSEFWGKMRAEKLETGCPIHIDLDATFNVGGANTPLFIDVTAGTGFDVQTTSNPSYGSSLHWADLDDDGDLDAIISGNSAKAFLSDSAGSSFFATALGDRRRGGALADLDNDGDVDFWSVGVGGYTNEGWHRNDGTGSLAYIGNAGFSNPSNNEGCAAADVNGDGWCDIVMFSENGNWIGVNLASETLSLGGANDSAFGLNDSGDEGNGDYCSSGDVNNDGFLDYFYHYNSGKLFLSDGDGTYTHANGGISVTTGNSDKMGSAWGDYDNDGDLDLFVCRYDDNQRGYLWRNDAGVFTNVAVAAGVKNESRQRSACWGDYDNDGDLDLYVANVDAPNILYRNNGDGTFTSANEGASAGGKSHDSVFVDYDNDGDLDLAVVQEDTTNILYQNGTNDDQYLKVRVIGAGAGGTNVAGIGVRLELYNESGTTLLQRRDIGVARGYGGSEPLWAHFGGVDPAVTYLLRAYFRSGVMDLAVTPNSESTTIGAVTIAQMTTIQEPEVSAGYRITQWLETQPVDP